MPRPSRRPPKRRAAAAASRPQRPRKPAWSVPDCRRFTGYKPCFPGTQCYRTCADPAPRGTRILIINLDAMGNVLVTTSILPALKRQYPQCHISWITLKNAAPLLAQNPYVDRVHVWEPEQWLILQSLTFDLLLNVDKSVGSGALAGRVNARTKRGFGINDTGVIVPLNAEAEENYLLGLDDHLKFRVNQKSGSRLLCEQFKLPYRRDRYVLPLSKEETAFVEEFKRSHGLVDRHGTSPDLIVGFNTGCSELYPNKKMTIEQHVVLINRLRPVEGIRLVLLGGPEDTLRNAEIARQVGDAVLQTPTTDGVRRGLCAVDLCDVVISGDSFGMHAAIGRGKYVIVWFGVSCAPEIDLFDNGMKLIPRGLECSPCWKKQCPYNLECLQQIDLDAIVSEVAGLRARRDELRAGANRAITLPV
jgi:ADP-heptose:LPS heptosyltransferase